MFVEGLDLTKTVIVYEGIENLGKFEVMILSQYDLNYDFLKFRELFQDQDADSKRLPLLWRLGSGSAGA